MRIWPLWGYNRSGFRLVLRRWRLALEFDPKHWRDPDYPLCDFFYPTAHMRYRYCLHADCRAEEWWSRVFRRWQAKRTWW